MAETLVKQHHGIPGRLCTSPTHLQSRIYLRQLRTLYLWSHSKRNTVNINWHPTHWQICLKVPSRSTTYINRPNTIHMCASYKLYQLEYIISNQNKEKVHLQDSIDAPWLGVLPQSEALSLTLQPEPKLIAAQLNALLVDTSWCWTVVHNMTFNWKSRCHHVPSGKTMHNLPHMLHSWHIGKLLIHPTNWNSKRIGGVWIILSPDCPYRLCCQEAASRLPLVSQPSWCPVAPGTCTDEKRSVTSKNKAKFEDKNTSAQV